MNAVRTFAQDGDYKVADLSLAEWGRIVPELDRLGLLTKVDRAYLVAYCEAWATFNAAREAMAEYGPLVAGRDGGLVKNPAAQVMRDAADLMLKFGSRFGLSPSDRTRLSVPSESEDGPDAQVLSLLSWQGHSGPFLGPGLSTGVETRRAVALRRYSPLIFRSGQLASRQRSSSRTLPARTQARRSSGDNSRPDEGSPGRSSGST